MRVLDIQRYTKEVSTCAIYLVLVGRGRMLLHSLHYVESLFGHNAYELYFRSLTTCPYAAGATPSRDVRSRADRQGRESLAAPRTVPGTENGS